jgi:hypothetical protein
VSWRAPDIGAAISVAAVESQDAAASAWREETKLVSTR